MIGTIVNMTRCFRIFCPWLKFSIVVICNRIRLSFLKALPDFFYQIVGVTYPGAHIAQLLYDGSAGGRIVYILGKTTGAYDETSGIDRHG